MSKTKTNKNCCIVKTKADHLCKSCNARINQGSIVFSINPKGAGRGWLCKECSCQLHEINKAISSYHMIPFGDEGMIQAQLQYISNLKDEFLERCNDAKLAKVIEELS